MSNLIDLPLSRYESEEHQRITMPSSNIGGSVALRVLPNTIQCDLDVLNCSVLSLEFLIKNSLAVALVKDSFELYVSS